MATLKYSGSSMFRQRIAVSLLSNRPLKIDKIRSENDNTPGLQDFEANFLRLIEKITDGCRIEINETGTALYFRPGMLVGGKLSHDCGTSRSIGWFLEGILPLAPFCKSTLQLSLSGITNDDIDLSVDTLANVTLPLLKNFGIYNSSLKIKQRGAPPGGGGLIEVVIPMVRTSIKSVYLVDEGLTKRVRGIAYCTHVSPTIITRVIDSCRAVLNDFLPDVFIHTDHYKGKKEGGSSPGYALSLVAETTTGALLSTERTAKCRKRTAIPGVEELLGPQAAGAEVPEDVGRQAALALLEEVYSGGVVDSAHQPLMLLLMVLTPEDVSKVRFGMLSTQAIATLRLLKDAFGVAFKIVEDRQYLPAPSLSADEQSEGGEYPSDNSYGDEDGEDNEDEAEGDEEDDNDDEEEDEEEGDEEGEDEEAMEYEDESDQADSSSEVLSNNDEQMTDGLGQQKYRKTYLLTCLGIGYVNANRKAT